MANDSVHARDQHRCLTEMLDPVTTLRLAQRCDQRMALSGGWRGGQRGRVSRGESRRLAGCSPPTSNPITSPRLPGWR